MGDPPSSGEHPYSAYAGSAHHFLVGHCEQEAAVVRLVREAKEEVGVLPT
ncbi:hypothetical protein AB0892_23410 [Streptomyces sp. NPDC005409]